MTIQCCVATLCDMSHACIQMDNGHLKHVAFLCHSPFHGRHWKEGRKYFIFGYMVLDIWLRTIQIVREETRCRHMGYSFRLAARVLLYASSHRQDNTYHGLCYTSRGALAGTRNSSMGPPHEGSIRRPIAP